MRALAQWTVAVAGSLAIFAASWAVCHYAARLDNGTSLGIAAAPLAVALAVLGWWAGREPSPPETSDPVTDTAAGQGSQAVLGGVGMNIGDEADLRGATITIRTGAESLMPDPSHPGQDPASPIVGGDIPRPPPAYQDRVPLLAALREPTGKPGVCVVQAVTGMRGVGKTQAAAAYARQCLNEKWRLVAWINAESMAAALDGLARVASAVGAGGPADGQPQAARALRHWLETSGHRCLIVFDNASEPSQLRPYLPAVGDAQIVITSTSQSVASLGTGVPVGVFTEHETLSYLAERTGSADAEGARQLAAELGYLPLALAQAAAVITAQRLSYPAYLARLRALPVGEYLARTDEDPYPRAVAAAILLSLRAACDSDTTGLAAPVMDGIALLSPAGVPRALLYATNRILARRPDRRRLQRRSRVRHTPAQLDAALAHLAGVSLLTFSLDDSAISAHRLTMRVVREQRLHEGTQTAVAARVISLLTAVAQEQEPVWQHAAAARNLTQQITALNDHVAPVLQQASSGVARDLLRLRGWALQCLTGLADNPGQAIRLGEELVADCGRTLGPDDRITMTVRNDLANTYRQAGRAEEAVALHKRNLADRERVLGPDHHETLLSRNNLAGAYEAAGRLDEAIPLAQRVLADRERMLGTTHSSTLTARTNLAYKYELAGRVGEAISLFELALAQQERVLGRDHRRTLITRNGLARAYQKAGRLDEAIALYERTLADRERVLGPEHPHTMTSRHGLAIAHRLAGRPGEAARLLERTLVGRERILGPDHPRTLTTCHDLAVAYHQADRLRDAHLVFERALADHERVYGTDHPDTRAVRNGLIALQQDVD